MTARDSATLKSPSLHSSSSVVCSASRSVASQGEHLRDVTAGA